MADCWPHTMRKRWIICFSFSSPAFFAYEQTWTKFSCMALRSLMTLLFVPYTSPTTENSRSRKLYNPKMARILFTNMQTFKPRGIPQFSRSQKTPRTYWNVLKYWIFKLPASTLIVSLWHCAHPKHLNIICKITYPLVICYSSAVFEPPVSPLETCTGCSCLCSWLN